MNVFWPTLIFIGTILVFLSPVKIQGFLKSYVSLSLAREIATTLSNVCFKLMVTIACFSAMKLTFEVSDIIIIFLDGVRTELSVVEVVPVVVERLPCEEITGFPHMDRIVKNPWTTTGTIIVGVIVVYKIISLNKKGGLVLVKDIIPILIFDVLLCVALYYLSFK